MILTIAMSLADVCTCRNSDRLCCPSPDDQPRLVQLSAYRALYCVYNPTVSRLQSAGVSAPQNTRGASSTSSPLDLGRARVARTFRRVQPVTGSPSHCSSRGRVDAAEVDVRLQVAVHEIGQARSRTGRTPANAAAE